MAQFAFGSDVRRIRRKNGLSQREFAERIGVSQSTVSRWESGKRGLSEKTLYRIMSLFFP